MSDPTKKKKNMSSSSFVLSLQVLKSNQTNDDGLKPVRKNKHKENKNKVTHVDFMNVMTADDEILIIVNIV